jgi:hypothetical protein
MQRFIRIFLFVAVLISVGIPVWAAPFLECDPQTGVEWYELTGLPAPLDGSHVPAQADGAIRMDLAQTPIGGPYALRVRACNIWGCSDYVPFEFARPGAPIPPAGLRLGQ